jgi:hypothetical protein
MAFTSGVQYAGTDAGHSVELLVSGRVGSLRLYDRPGNDALEHKGDHWVFPLASFNLNHCITLRDITRVSIIESSNDGWNIASIVTIVRDTSGRYQLLTRDFGANRWIDGNAHDSHRRFELTRDS